MKQIKISIHDKNTSPEDVLGTNGVAILDNICTKAETEEDLSTGNYVLDATFLIDEEGIYNYLKEEAILKVKMDYGDEIFTISKVENGTRYIDIVARQITISESLALHLEDVRPTEINGVGAMQHMLDNAYGRKNITVFSDITKKGTAYYIEKSLYEALHDSENSFQEVWGGEILRRQYNLSILSHVGQNNGVCIIEGRNLKGFEGTSNIDELCTRGRGQGYNGIKGNYILSPLFNSYSGVYTKIFEYSNVKVRDENTKDDEEGIIFDSEKEAIDYLDKLVEKEFSENDVDKIKATYSIDYEQLEKTVEYKDYIKSERTLLGDTIRVYIPRLDVDINVRVMVKKYDILAQKVISLTLSNYIQPKAIKFSDIQNQLNKLSQENKNMLEQAKDFATASIIAGMKNSYVIVKKNMIIVGDTADINTMQSCWIWTKDGLGHSSTGINGQMNTALTSDGQIVADRILTGVLSAILIRSLDGKSYFDLATGNLVLGDGRIEIKNKSGANVLYADSSGNINIRGNIYNYDSSGVKRCSIEKQKLNVYDNSENYIGGIGLNSKKGNIEIKGLTFDLEPSGKYMAFARKESDDSDEYTTMLCFSRENGMYEEDGLHLGCDLYGHWKTLHQVKLDEVSSGGYSGYTGAIDFIQSITANEDGSISWKYSKLQVRNGIIVGYWT